MALDIDKLYAKYAGQTLDYDGVSADAGQCVQWVEYALTDTEYGFGLQPFWGNAIDWWNKYGGSLLAFDKVTDGSIKKGDIVIFNEQTGSVYGHIDLALADGTTSNFLGADSNWGGNQTVHQVQHSNASYVIGSLRLKGSEEPVITEADVRFLFEKALGLEPSQDDINWGVGKPWNVYMDAIYKRPEALVQRADVKYAFNTLLKIEPAEADYAWGVGRNWRQFMDSVYKRPEFKE